MKTLLTTGMLAAACAVSAGCFSYETRTRTTRETVVPGTTVTETVVTELPVGYRTRTYRGERYYYSGNVVYRTHTTGGYVVVPSPW